MLRIALLYNYGGTYLDTDIITLQTHPDTSQIPNFVAFEEPGSINGAILRLQAHHAMLSIVGRDMGRTTVMSSRDQMY